MVLDNLAIFNYKNIREAELAFSPNVNCFVGRNGEGKTNVLDAIYYLSFCKSSTNYNDSQVICHDADFFTLSGDYTTESDEHLKIYCGVKRQHKKVFKRNGKEYGKLSEHIGQILLVLVSPIDQELISGGSELRRKFMDMVISQYDAEYLHLLIRYRKALQQRNVLLRGDAEPDSDFIGIYENEMALSGEAIYRKRKNFVDEFLPIFRQIYAQLGGADENIDLTYRSHCEDGPLLQTLQASRPKDRVMGFSLKGVHRDDLDMQLNGYPIKREGSQGQNKTFMISMKLAQFDFLKGKGNRRVPILLLDDIFDKLDSRRVEQIVEMVAGNRFGQIFITDTNRDFLKSVLERTGKDYRMFNVEAGKVTLQ
jgi:DNA replication and repair protein RecF